MDVLVNNFINFCSVVFIDLVLAGDNAVVVGCLAAGLPRAEQRRVILFGILAALVMRIAFALIAVRLLSIVGLLLAGGLLLMWVAWKMWRELAKQPSRECATASGSMLTPDHDCDVMPAQSFGGAVVAVAIADLSMSLDNVLAVAGTARDTPIILAFGLALSIALMGLGAGMIARLIERRRWIAYVGLGIVAIVAVDMVWQGGHEVWTAAAAGI